MHSNEVLNYPPPMNQSKMSSGGKKKYLFKNRACVCHT